jgi:hypothetical protein
MLHGSMSSPLLTSGNSSTAQSSPSSAQQQKITNDISRGGSSSNTSQSASGGRKSSSNSRHVHHEDLLLRSWRSTAHGVALVTGKAERVVAVATSPDSTPAAQDAAMKDLNDATIGFLRNHVEWGRSISYIEAKLEGKAAEMEALHHYLRSHPSMGRNRKRKLSVTNT